MARRSAERGAYEDYEVDHEHRADATYLGTVGDGTAMLYHEDDHAVFRGTPDEETETIRHVEGSDRELGDDESIGDTIKRIGDEHGWESVSAFAEKHLGADEDDREA